MCTTLLCSSSHKIGVDWTSFTSKWYYYMYQWGMFIQESSWINTRLASLLIQYHISDISLKYSLSTARSFLHHLFLCNALLTSCSTCEHDLNVFIWHKKVYFGADFDWVYCMTPSDLFRLKAFCSEVISADSCFMLEFEWMIRKINKMVFSFLHP